MNYKLPHTNFSFNFKSGQATLLAILIVSAVAIVTAVGVATRQSIGVRRTTYTSQTDQAFGCANSAVDAAMLNIKEKEEAGINPSGDSVSGQTLQDEDSSDICTYSYDISDLTADSGGISIAKLPRDAVQQFTTDGASNVGITFTKLTTPEGEDPNVGLEVTVAYQESSGDTGVQKVLGYCGISPDTTKGFTNITPDALTKKCTLNVDFGALGVPSGAQSIIRIRPYYDSVTLEVSGLPAGVSQGYLISAHGVSGTVQRNIEVMRMNPQLPAIFDYVLYSEEGSITK